MLARSSFLHGDRALATLADLLDGPLLLLQLERLAVVHLPPPANGYRMGSFFFEKNLQLGSASKERSPPEPFAGSFSILGDGRSLD